MTELTATETLLAERGKTHGDFRTMERMEMIKCTCHSIGLRNGEHRDWCPATPAPAMTATEALLAERGKTHGDFRDHAKVTQRLKHEFDCIAAGKLSWVQQEAADMILHKLGRIAAGDPNFRDHWDDIAGYARLVSQDLERD